MSESGRERRERERKKERKLIKADNITYMSIVNN